MPEGAVRLSERTRLFVLVAMTVAILVFVNVQIMQKEDIIENGETLLLRLAPQDPRSLLQGDYMALRYAMTRDIALAARESNATDGQIIVELAENGEALFVDLFVGQELAEDQRLLRFRKRGDAVRLASDAYFFEEGQGDSFAGARFGEIRVGPAGDAVLIGLRDQDGNRLGTSSH
jgi:uncharacterized membrane-anchored protein